MEALEVDQPIQVDHSMVLNQLSHFMEALEVGHSMVGPKANHSESHPIHQALEFRFMSQLIVLLPVQMQSKLLIEDRKLNV